MASRNALPSQRLRSKELQRLIQISNGSFVPGNNDSNSHTKSIEENNVVMSSVSKKLSSYKAKRRLRRSESKKSQMGNDSSINTEGLQNYASKKDSDDVIEERGRLHRSSSRQSRRSKSRMRSGRSDISVTSRSRNHSRSKSRVRGSSSNISNADSISLKAKSLDDFDVNVAAAKSLILRRSVSGSQSSIGGRSIHSTSGRTASGMRGRKSDDCSSIGGDSVLSNQLSMISNLEELSELDATVMSAGEGTSNERSGHERTKYSRRSVSSSRSHSRSKGGRSDFSKRHSRRRKKSSSGSISGSVYTTESFSANDILNELQSTTSKPSPSMSSNVETSDALKDLLRKSREVLKEASESRRMRSRSLAGSKMSVGSRRSDTLTSVGDSRSQSQSISIASSSLQSTKVLLQDQHEFNHEKPDIISKAEHSYLDSLAESFHKTDNFGGVKIEESLSTESPYETKQPTKSGSSSFSKSAESKETSPRLLLKKTNAKPTELSFDSRANSSSKNIEWPDNFQDFFTENFDANAFNASNPFSSTSYDSEESSGYKNTDTAVESIEKPSSSVVQPFEHTIDKRDVSSDNGGAVSTPIDSPSTVLSLTSKSSGGRSNENYEVKDEVPSENTVAAFETSQAPWPNISNDKTDKEINLNAVEAIISDSDNPFTLDNSFGFNDGWSSANDISTDAFNPFFDVDTDQNDTFLTHDCDDSRNVTVLSYSKGESMEDFFNDLNINDYDDDDNENKVTTQKVTSLSDADTENLSYNSDEVSKHVVTDEETDINSGKAMEKSSSSSVPFDESFEGSKKINTVGDKIHSKTVKFVETEEPKTRYFEQQFDEESNSDHFDMQSDMNFRDTFSNNLINGSTNNFEMNEKANFMMGFVSDFPSSIDDTWENTYDDAYVSTNEAPIVIETSKDPFVIKGDDDFFNTNLQEKALFDPFAIETNQDEGDEFLQPKDQVDQFFSTPNKNRTTQNDFFIDHNGFSESFGNVNFFKNTNKTESISDEKKSDGVRWNMNKNFTESFPAWDDEWETVDQNESHYGKNGRKKEGRNGANSSCATFSTDKKDYSPNSVIPHDRIFIS